MKQSLLILLFCSLFNLPFAQSKQYLTQIGTVDSLYSNALNETRQLYIQLPEGYSTENKAIYPIVFILDGEAHLPALKIVHDFYSGGFIPEMILVGIANSQNRTRDLTTSEIKEFYGQPYTEANGKANKFLEFIETELIPFIENKYKASSYRTLIGHSYGGLFTLYTLLEKPDLFANYLSIDPSLDWDNQALLKRYKSEFQGELYDNKSLFMSLSGQLNMQDPSITIDNVMQDSSPFTMFPRSNITLKTFLENSANSKLAFDWKFYPNDLHGTIPLPSIKEGLLSMFKWFQMEDTFKLNAPETSLEDIKNIFKYREGKLKVHFGYDVPPYPEELINMMGYMSQDMGQKAKAKFYFEYGIIHYPENPNSYDSMADFYENQNDYENALEYETIAYELSGNDYHKQRIEEFKSKL